uniref:Mis18 domain-containing protein n=1 Tax=Neogobius melanostomus TaxID=47308 RepID=A0A8C6UUX7_9GOBI
MEFNDSTMELRKDQVKELREIDRRWMTFHCEKCNTVFGDGLSVCGEVKSMGCILLLKVTKDIVIDDKKETELKGDLAQCMYSFLLCRCCRSFVGRIIHSSPTRLANCRSMFLLHKPSLCCYLLNSSSMVKATSISFELKPIGESMKEMMREFEGMYKQIIHLKKDVLDRSTIS